MAEHISQNLFEVETARNMSIDDVVNTFVPTQAFWRMLSAKNHILLGSRGSGKTVVAKMLSHDHLSIYDEPRAKRIIETKAFIGIYVPTKIKWVGGLTNKPWQTDDQKEQFFQWRLNIATCLALLNTLNSCLKTYICDIGIRASTEVLLCSQLSSAWFDSSVRCKTISELQRFLRDIEYRKQQQLARKRALGYLPPDELLIGTSFEIDLFDPLRKGIEIASHILNFSDKTVWFMCLDEAEFLDIDHHTILNTHMRADSGNLFFKITTLPYCHYSLDTTTKVSLDPGDDFDYIYLDNDPAYKAITLGKNESIGTRFARTLFSRRAKASGTKYSTLNIDDFLGDSILLDTKQGAWTNNSNAIDLLNLYASEETIARAKRLYGTDSFNNSIGRKMLGALILRDKVENSTGASKLDVYSGATMAMRCGDFNPRRLIRIFNSMILAAGSKSQNNIRKPATPTKQTQTQVLLSLSSKALATVQSEPKHGAQLYNLLNAIGNFMHANFYGAKLTTDQISSISISPDISDTDWELIKYAVTRSLLHPNINHNNPDELPYKCGVFHLAYILAPHFRLLPRRGSARSLSLILNSFDNDMSDKQLELFPKPKEETDEKPLG